MAWQVVWADVTPTLVCHHKISQLPSLHLWRAFADCK